MKTIEERAFDIIGEVMTMDDRYSRDEVVMMLERMAEEQKAIDEVYFADASKIVIDKACEWLEKHSEFWVYDDGFKCVTEMLDNFRKAMEE